MDHCESLPIVGSSLIIYIEMRGNEEYRRMYERREG
jgi:hypothetical protein